MMNVFPCFSVAVEGSCSLSHEWDTTHPNRKMGDGIVDENPYTGCMKLKTLFLLLLIFAAACGPLPQIVVTPATPTSPTFTPISTLTLAPITPSPVVVPTSAPSSSTVLVDVLADNVMLRSNPGTLFPAIRAMSSKETLTAFGRAPGDGWLFVKTSNNQAGWVSASFVTIAPIEMGLLAEIKPTDVQVIQGNVTDANQNPLSGVGFALTQSQTRDDATTNAKGDFYFFLPQFASGAWRVDYVSLACTSNTRVGSCPCPTVSCGQPNPPSTTINLPLQEVMIFVWK